MLPLFAVSDHGVEDGQEFSHAGSDGDFGWFSGFDQTLIESMDNRVEPGGGHGRHVEGGPNVGAPSPYGTFAAKGAAVTVHGRDADEGGDLFAG